MSTAARRLFALHVILALLLAACGQGASPEPLPTEVVAAAATATHTEAPTATEPPTATVTPSPLPPTDTPTPVPPTKTPRPTATATPGPGDIVYFPEFATDWKAWEEIYFGSEKFSVEPDGPILNFVVDGVDTWVYSLYTGDFDDADVQIDVDVTVVSGPNRNNLSIVCRYSEELGWYEFNILSGGLWTIYKYDETNGYRELSSGGSTAIHMNNALNHLTAECIGDTLTFYINDVKVGAAKDGAFADGTFGMSASTFDIGKLNVRFENFTVRLADPEAELGAAVAPTVPPGFGSGGTDADATWTAYFGAPAPGETLANASLQFGVMLDLGLQAVGGIPASCGQIFITNTAVVQVLKPFVFNDQQNLVEGEWLERWTLTACGVVSNYQVHYTANGVGIDYVVSRQ